MTEQQKVASLVTHFDGLATPPLEPDAAKELGVPAVVTDEAEGAQKVPEEAKGEEEEKLDKMEEGVVVSAEGAKEGAKDAEEKGEKEGEKEKDDLTPLAKLLLALPALSATEQALITRTLSLLPSYPPSLPLSDKWTLYFSDTAKKVSNPNGNNSHGSAADNYTDLQTELFSVEDVAGLCGSLKAYKRLARSKRARGGDMDTMGLAGMRPGMNLYFFRSKAMPAWEDVWNEKGGRLTVSPPTNLFDATFERLLLLLAGHSLESEISSYLLTKTPPSTLDPADQGQIIGIVGSRRARGDRIEIWLGGKGERGTPNGEWIDALKRCLGPELPEGVESGKYKKHF